MIIIGRDGVLNDQPIGQVNHRTTLKLRQDRVEQVATLSKAGHTLAIIASQPGLSRGLMDLDELDAIHYQIETAIESAGGHILGLFYCAHEPADQCQCRPPATGLFEVMAIEANTETQSMTLISAHRDEQEAAKRVGCKVIAIELGSDENLIKKVG